MASKKRSYDNEDKQVLENLKGGNLVALVLAIPSAHTGPELSLSNHQYTSFMESKKEPTSTTTTSKKSWSKDQEISLLNGMIQFSARGLDPATNKNDFYAFMKNSMASDFSKKDLSKKLQQMKDNYRHSLIRADVVSDPDENKVFNLSKQIWGAGGAFASPEATSELCLKEMAKFHENNVGLEEEAINKRLELIDKETRAEYERKLWEIKKLEVKLNRKRAQIVDSQMKEFLDAFDEMERNDLLLKQQ